MDEEGREKNLDISLSIDVIIAKSQRTTHIGIFSDFGHRGKVNVAISIF